MIYDKNSTEAYAVNAARDEIAISNLIAIVNNENIFSRLDPNTREELLNIVCGYAKACATAFEKTNNTDSEKIRGVLD